MPEKSCEKVRDLLDKKMDGCLLAGEAAAVESHLSQCDPCRRTLHGLERVSAWLRTDRRAAPAGFTARVLSRVEALGEPSLHEDRPAPLRHWRWVPAAAVLLLLLGPSVLLREPRPAPAGAEIEFQVASPTAGSVAIVGDFNDWEARGHGLSKGADGVWRIRLRLAPGRYQYSFVVDGREWMADPNAEGFVDNGYSGTNSIVEVAGPDLAASTGVERKG